VRSTVAAGSNDEMKRQRLWRDAAKIALKSCVVLLATLQQCIGDPLSILAQSRINRNSEVRGLLGVGLMDRAGMDDHMFASPHVYVRLLRRGLWFLPIHVDSRVLDHAKLPRRARRARR